MKRKKIVVLGGGTAGWLTALMVQRHITDKNAAIDVVVIESSKIPTIGVGEGTTGLFSILLKQLGLNEFEFLRETNATIKLGIRHRDWKKTGSYYDGPIDNPHFSENLPKSVQTTDFLYRFAISEGNKLSDLHLFQYLMNENKVHFVEKEGELLLLGSALSAYHFDNHLVAKYLKKKSKGVSVIDTKISSVKRNNQTGDIEALIDENGDAIEGDFFFDCSGFHRKLIGQELGVKWKSYQDTLPVNRAMTFSLSHENNEISPFTQAWAQKNGWMWQIPTYDRIGAGYVYDDRFTTPDKAQQEIEQTLGKSIQPLADIKINSGRIEQTWKSNCLAIGLSSSFMEPLEATSIHSTIVMVQLFLRDNFNEKLDFSAAEIEQYNSLVARKVDDYRDFINMHYVSERRDSEFWRAVSQDYILDTTKERLKLWSKEMPSVSHFPPLLSGLAHIETQLYYPVLDGLGLLDANLARQELINDPKLRSMARQYSSFLSHDNREACNAAYGHKAFLDKLHARA